jgi:hypothetical protein
VVRFSGAAWIASISSSRRAVSRASGVPLVLAEIPLPFNLLAGFSTGPEPDDLAFFFVAMLLFSPAPLATK